MKLLLPSILLPTASFLASGCLTGDAEAGKSTYQFQCAGCHGLDGAGGIEVGSVLDTAGSSNEPGTSADLRERVPLLTDDRILAVLHDGKGAMPGQFGADDTAAYDMLAYLRETF